MPPSEQPTSVAIVSFRGQIELYHPSNIHLVNLIETHLYERRHMYTYKLYTYIYTYMYICCIC